jgi:hypothetical protein
MFQALAILARFLGSILVVIFKGVWEAILESISGTIFGAISVTLFGAIFGIFLD